MKSSFNLRKLTAIALAGIMMCSTLTGCANSGLNDMADSINKKYNTSEPAEKITVTFDADGGTCDTTTLSIDKGQKITNIPSATKSTYDFLGWYDTNNNQLTTDTVINENITYTAKWKSKTTPVTKSTVKFDANGGMCDTTQIEVIDGQTISNIPEPFMNGYTFEGWFDDNGNKLTTDTVISYDIMYTAKWTKDKEPEVQKWSVTFNPNEGTFDNNPALQLITITVDNGKSIDTSNIPIVKRDGYDFAGWYTQANGGVLFEQSIKISSDRTLYAHWNKQMVQVTYDANGGTFSDGTSSKTSDIEKNATISNPPTPTRSNHTFNGWYTDQACTKAFNSSSKIASNITLYAKWTADKPASVTHKVTLNLQGGLFKNSGTNSYINVKDNNVLGQIPDVWKNGYTFKGWNTKADGTVKETFFGYYKEDGFKKKKNLGRVEQFDDNGDSKWKAIEEEWLKLFRNHKSVDGLSATAEVSGKDEWLCEAYMKTDYTKLTEADFQNTLNNYLAYLMKEGKVYES